MLVVLSDLHFQETAHSGPGEGAQPNVEPAAFRLLWRHLNALAEDAGVREPITVVLDGDVIEILRSERWLREGRRPYNFEGDPDEPMVATARAITRDILVENAAGIAALGGGDRAPSDVRFVLVYGNHDRLLREPALAPERAAFARALGRDVEFADEVLDERHRVAVYHGHELDWTCSEYQFTREYEGLEPRDPARRRLASLGDWVALELGTRMPHLGWEMLSSTDARWSDLSRRLRLDLHERLLGLEDLRPQVEVIRWLVQPGEITDAERDATDKVHPVVSHTEAVSRFLGDLMNELVTQAVPQLEPWLEAHGQPLFDRMALGAFELLGSTPRTASAVPTLIERMTNYFYGVGNPYPLLSRLPAASDPITRYIVCGHTHNPAMVPLRPSSRGGEAQWYFNTGTWRKTILRSPVGETPSWAAVKQLAFSVFFDEEETERATGRRRTSFDFWQGASQRF